jgi:hypothetical protein
MASLMEANGGIHRHFLNGKEELEAFQAGEFSKDASVNNGKGGFFCPADVQGYFWKA